MIGQERDLVRDSADDVGAGPYPHTMSDGTRQAVAKALAQLADPYADRGIGGVGLLEHSAECRRPGTAADAECLKVRMAECPAVLDRAGPDPRQPESGRLLCTPSARSGKSPMIFTQAAPAVTSARIAPASSSGATGECMRGKYRFAGTGNRPAAVTPGRPAAAARAKPRVTWLPAKPEETTWYPVGSRRRGGRGRRHRAGRRPPMRRGARCLPG